MRRTPLCGVAATFSGSARPIRDRAGAGDIRTRTDGRDETPGCDKTVVPAGAALVRGALLRAGYPSTMWASSSGSLRDSMYPIPRTVWIIRASG